MAAKQELNLTNHDIYHPRAYRERTKDRKSLMTSTLQYQLCSLYSGKGNHSRGNISKAIWTNERSGLHSGRGQYLTGEAREQLEFKQNILFRKKKLHFTLWYEKYWIHCKNIGFYFIWQNRTEFWQFPRPMFFKWYSIQLKLPYTHIHIHIKMIHWFTMFLTSRSSLEDWFTLSNAARIYTKWLLLTADTLNHWLQWLEVQKMTSG